MPKTKVRSTVTVDVEDFEVVRHEVAPVDEPVIERPVFVSDLGGWWEALSFGVLLIAALTIFRSFGLLIERLDVFVSFLFILVAIGVASVTGKYAGQENKVRKVTAIAMIGFGLAFSLISLLTGPLPASSATVSAAIGLTLTGWSLRRLLGESFIRCLSIGLASALPLGFLAGGYIEKPFGGSIKSFVDQNVFWYTGALADLNNVPYAPQDKVVAESPADQDTKSDSQKAASQKKEKKKRPPIEKIKFTSGMLEATATFNNRAGILVVIGASLAFSILARHSLLVASIAASSSFLWWVVFRSGFCVAMATSKSLDGSLSDLAMPLYALIGLILLSSATSYCIGAIMAPIPVDPNQFEVTGLTQIYNALVSFPQLGPSHVSMARDLVLETPAAPIHDQL